LDPNFRIMVVAYNADPANATRSADGADIVVRQAAPTVRVDPADPRVVVRQAQPQVTVNQAQPEIIVRQPQPTVRVDIPQPEIIVRMPEPDVNVAMAQPDVSVLMERPDVSIMRQGQPQVQVDRVQPQVLVQRNVSSQPEVQVQQAEGQPTVRYERAQPRVIVNQAQGQPNVRIERMGENSQASAAMQQSGQRQQAEGRNPVRPVAVSQIKGKDVYNARGEDLGEVERVILGQGNQVFGVVRFGEFLGLGGEARILPLSRMTLREDRIIISGMTEAELRGLPPYREGLAGYREADPNYRARMASYYAAADRAHDQAGIAVNERMGGDWSFAAFDRDQNRTLARNEFNAFADRVYSGWDENRNQRMERNEFYGGLYSVWDMDRDGRLTNAEYDQAWNTWGEGLGQADFGRFDANRDGILNEQEFAAGWGDSGLYERWDADGGGWLAGNELGNGLFGLWGGDGQVAENEFTPWLGNNWGVEPVATADLNTREPRRDPADTGAVGTTARTFQITDLEDRDVYSIRGQKIGEVKRLVERIGDKQGYVVLEHGGFLGLGEKEVPIPLNRVFMMGNRLVAAGLTEAEVNAIPDWDFNSRTFREFGDNDTVEIGIQG
jgi:sporulation protein YlmC with PRC-barrel domain